MEETTESVNPMDLDPFVSGLFDFVRKVNMLQLKHC